MSYAEKIENVVIGSGEAGKYLAWTLARSGRKTAMIERSMIGGSCPNIACLPSKNVVHSAKVASLARRGGEFGVTSAGFEVDMRHVRQRKRNMVNDLIAIHLDRYKSTGAELVIGNATITAPRTISVALNDGGSRLIEAEKLFLNLGTRSAMPRIAGINAAKPMSHVEALELDVVPKHIIILGGGYIGLEFAQAFRRFGSDVTVIQRGPQLAPKEDPDVAEALLAILIKEGIRVLLDATPEKIKGLSGEEIRVTVAHSSGPLVIEGSHLLLATGRVPNTENVGLEAAGVELDERGFIRVNERLETTAASVWAMGDCAGSPQFTHAAFDDFRVVRGNLAGGHRTTTGRLIPSTLFTDPELARVGMNETEARERGIPYRVAKLPMAAILRTRTLSETEGFLKALVAADNDRILGFTALGVDAGEIMAAVQTAMLGNMPYTSLRDAIFTHPTLAEGLVFLFETVQARSATQQA